MYIRSLRDAFFVKQPILWINFCQNTNAVFGKVTNTQYCFLFKSLKNGNLQLIKKTIDALLTNLSKHVSPWSKAFDFELLIAKLHACGFIIAALRVTHSYLANREQRQTCHSVLGNKLYLGHYKGLFWDLCFLKHLSVWPFFHNKGN